MTDNCGAVLATTVRQAARSARLARSRCFGGSVFCDVAETGEDFGIRREYSKVEFTTDRSDREGGLRDRLSISIDSLYRYVYVRLGGDSAAADEVLQQTALVALDHANAPDEPEAQGPWLRGIARNLIRRHWRVSGPGEGGRLSADAKAAWSLLSRVESDDSPHDLVIKKEERDQLFYSIASLPSEDQWLIYAFYRHGRTRAEIAADLGTTPKAVQSRLYRVRSRLRAMLANIEDVT